MNMKIEYPQLRKPQDVILKDGRTLEAVILDSDAGICAQLQKEDLSYVNFSGCNLRGAVFFEAYLDHADFAQADLASANFQNATLTNADFWCANLVFARFVGTTLKGANFSQAHFNFTDFKGADLSGANLDFASWPLWCGSKDVTVDKNLAAQLAVHFCVLECDDPEVIEAQKALLTLAKQSHRAGELGLLRGKCTKAKRLDDLWITQSEDEDNF
jgi:hypothetical protein